MNKLFKRFYKTTFHIYILYVFISICSFCIGYFLPKFLNTSSLLSAYQKIASHFKDPLYDLNNFFDWLNISFKYSLPYIICIILVLIFSFSSSKLTMYGIILTYIGIKSGCEISLVYLAYKSVFESYLIMVEILAFFVLKITISILCLRYIVYASLFSKSEEEYVDISSNRSAIHISKFILCSVFRICSLIAFYGMYCFIIKII